MKKQLLVFVTLGTLPLMLTSCKTVSRYKKYENADKYIFGSQTYEEAVNNISIDWVSGKLNLVEDESITGVKIEEENELEAEAKVHSWFNNGDLDIKFFKSGYRCAFDPDKDKVLTVTYHPGLTSLSVSLTSGSLNSNNIRSEKVNIALTSGSIAIGDVYALTDVNIAATSGELDTGKINADTVNLSLTSGAATIRGINAKNVSSKSTSGKMIIGESNVATLASSFTSGEFRAKFISAESVDVKGTSGSIEITLPEEGGVVHATKTSGSIKIERTDYHTYDGDYLIGTGDGKYNLNITSGSITVK